MTQPNEPSNDQRLRALESRLDRLEGEFREQASFLVDGLIALSSQTTSLANRVDRMSGFMEQLARDAREDRAAIGQILNYLFTQRPNGSGDR